MEVVPPRSYQDIVDCVEMYTAHEVDFEPDKKACIRFMECAWKTGKFVRLCINKDQIVGFILADVVKILYVKVPVFQQLYFCSIGGIRGAKCAILLHEAMISHAETKRIPLCASQCSHYDEDLKFAKFLEHQGWSRRGYLCFYKTSHFKE